SVTKNDAVDEGNTMQVAFEEKSPKDQEIASETDEEVLLDGGEKLFNIFKVGKVSADFSVNGLGRNIDSIAFWEAPNPSNTLMFVTAKSGDLVEVWRYPFLDNEQTPLRIDGIPNGVEVDQERSELLIGDARNNRVIVFSLPSFQFKREFGGGVIGGGETNLDILHRDGDSFAYVTNSKMVYVFNSATGQKVRTISPPVSEMETVLADDFHQTIYVPEEQGASGFRSGVYSYNYDGTLNKKNGSNHFGNSGVFVNDEEGIVLYSCASNGLLDDGSGLIIISEQSSPVNQFEFFNRQTWKHLGTLQVEGVKGTDGIAIFQKPLPNFPEGIFAAVDDDSRVAIVDWRKIMKATGFSCDGI
ncbi:phytase, partial [Patescibacteria group bacterium]